MIPLAFYLGFTCDLRLQGIWYSIPIGTGFQCIAFGILILSTDW